MHTITLNDVDLTALQQAAAVLGRILNSATSAPAVKAKPDVNFDNLEEFLGVAPFPRARKKARKADLAELVAKRHIKANERLYLVDFAGQRVGNESAHVDGGDLVYKGQRYSMSALADELLSKVGYTPGATRGPLHWATERGQTIMQLWSKVLAK